MIQAFPSIPQDVKDRLEKNGFKPYRSKPLIAYLNPHSDLCINDLF